MQRLNQEVVGRLAQSVRTIGLMNPISVQQIGLNQYALVAGWHRLEAIKQLDYPTIRANLLDCTSADQVKLAEIDENLMRQDLSAAERALHLLERKRLYEKLYPDAPAHGGDGALSPG
jgi:ParB family chromosome partitioning protein